MPIDVHSVLDMRSAAEIIADKGFAPGGKTQQYMANNLLKIFDGYVPLRSGILKGSATRNLSAPYQQIVYDGPYAKRLYYNPQYQFNEGPQRGGYWASRAWADHKDTFLAELQEYVRRG